MFIRVCVSLCVLRGGGLIRGIVQYVTFSIDLFFSGEKLIA